MILAAFLMITTFAFFLLLGDSTPKKLCVRSAGLWLALFLLSIFYSGSAREDSLMQEHRNTLIFGFIVLFGLVWTLLVATIAANDTDEPTSRMRRWRG